MPSHDSLATPGRSASPLAGQLAVASLLVLAFGVAAAGIIDDPGDSSLWWCLLIGCVVLSTLVFGVPRMAAALLALVLILGAFEPPRVFGLSVSTVVLALALIMLLARRCLNGQAARMHLPGWSLAIASVLALTMTQAGAVAQLVVPALAAAITVNLLRERRSLALAPIGWAGLVHAVIGISESLLHYSVAYTSWKTAAAADIGGIRRAASTIGDPNYLAAFLLAATPGVVMVTRRWPKPLRYASFAGYAAAVILTFSRAAMLAGAVMIVYFAVRAIRRSGHGRAGGALLGIAVAGAVLAASPLAEAMGARFSLSDASVTSRLTVQEAALQIFLAHPLRGVGLGNLSHLLEATANSLVALDAYGNPAFLAQTDPLNTYLLVGAEQGIAGLILLVALLVTGFIRSVRRDPALAATVMALAILALTLDFEQFVVFWCVICVAVTQRTEPASMLDPERPVQRAEPGRPSPPRGGGGSSSPVTAEALRVQPGADLHR